MRYLLQATFFSLMFFANLVLAGVGQPTHPTLLDRVKVIVDRPDPNNPIQFNEHASFNPGIQYAGHTSYISNQPNGDLRVETEISAWSANDADSAMELTDSEGNYCILYADYGDIYPHQHSLRQYHSADPKNNLVCDFTMTGYEAHGVLQYWQVNVSEGPSLEIKNEKN
jgi:hypothetical protein